MPSGIDHVSQAQLPTTYQGVVKLALQPRQTRVFVFSLVTLHVVFSLALLQLTAIVSPIVWLASLVSFATAIVPLLVLRKRTISQTTTLASPLAKSNAVQLNALLFHLPALWHQVAYHSASFAILSFIYCLSVTALRGSSATLAPQVWIPSHQSYYLNERFLFLIGQSAFLGALYTLVRRSWPSPHFYAVPRFDPTLNQAVPPSLQTKVVSSFQQTTPAAILAGGVAGLFNLIVYAVLRRSLWHFLLLLVGTRGFARRLFIPSFRPAFGYFDVALHSVLFSAAAVVIVETSYMLMDVYLSHPLGAISKFSKSPNSLLSSGVTDPVHFFSSHAFSELANVAANDKHARMSIFRDIHRDQSSWTHLSSACLDLIEAQTRFLALRGQQPKPQPVATTTATATATAAPVVQASAPSKPTSSQSTVADIPSVWDRLAMGQSHVDPASASAPAPSSSSSSKAAPQPLSSAARTSSSSSPSPSLSTYISDKAVSIAVKLWQLLPSDAKHALCPPTCRYYLFETSPASQAWNLAGRDFARVTWAISALKDLVCHSLQEDPYGTVQRDILKVLQVLVNLSIELRSFRDQLEEKSKTLDDKFKFPSSSQSQQQLVQAWTDSGSQLVEYQLSNAIGNVTDTFSKFNLNFSPTFEAKLSHCIHNAASSC